MLDINVVWQAEGGMHGSGGTVSPSGGSITTGPACGLNRGGLQSSYRSTVSDTEVENLQVCSWLCLVPQGRNCQKNLGYVASNRIFIEK